MHNGEYFYRDGDPLLSNFERVDWDRLCRDISQGYDMESADDRVVMDVIHEEIEFERDIEEEERGAAFKKQMKKLLSERCDLPAMTGRWREEPFPARDYVPLTTYRVTDNVTAQEANEVQSLLLTHLDGFLGPAYNYDDCGLTEAWMVSFRDRSFVAPSADDVIRTQIESLMDIMLGQVQDRVCNELGVLKNAPLSLGAEIIEAPVWGIDSSTRRMVEMAIEDNCRFDQRSEAKRRAFRQSIHQFIDKKLLPAINAQSPHVAHQILYALNSIIADSSCQMWIDFAQATANAVHRFGVDYFRVHPKGTGVICVCPEGIPAHVFIAEYLGELYPPYRWCEKLDVIAQAQKKFNLKPSLPDFWNILLERPRHDPNGYGLLFVDASEKANLGSTCSHSCDANCTSYVVSRGGKLTIALTSNRFIGYGEELTMDYYSVTSSELEWRAAVCLCGAPLPLFARSLKLYRILEVQRSFLAFLYPRGAATSVKSELWSPLAIRRAPQVL